ncbi:hypothetical protein [Bradyrhizobium sp. BWA-3-5]|uniref:hypothetical protein n=1 Tax=Bradyrhizobium sp. BWA-3-5 TaxID=3080013 RepID=UPI00293E7875|nr:hypothetical protein [Bradyrhizobium sp. BWA-3-5]WOH64306.1 hypothetical protein RX331_27605 [Bradyrhizobium sp. BWA-3-5]
MSIFLFKVLSSLAMNFSQTKTSAYWHFKKTFASKQSWTPLSLRWRSVRAYAGRLREQTDKRRLWPERLRR